MKAFVKKTKLYQIYREVSIWNDERKRFLNEIVIPENRIDGFSDREKLLADYKKAFWRHRVTFSEYYFQYRFWQLTENERCEFVSVSTMHKAYRKLVTPNVRMMLYDKVRFLEHWSEYVKRRWMAVSKDVSYGEFADFLSATDVIMKNPSSSRGNGIVKISKADDVNIKELYDRCVADNILVEECIVGDSEIQAFHPHSLNTIRIVTFLINGVPVVVGSFLRVGRSGICIDNAHAGGIFAQINLETGILESNGIDVYGNEYEYHPDTHKQFKGFEIPRWEDLCNLCCSAMAEMDELIVCGWDVCITDDGHIEIIEGNHAPDVDVLQSPLKTGKRDMFKRLLSNYHIKI